MLVRCSCGQRLADRLQRIGHRYAAAGEVGRVDGHRRILLEGLPSEPGLAGLHLLRHRSPPIAPTVEQRRRGRTERGFYALSCSATPADIA